MNYRNITSPKQWWPAAKIALIYMVIGVVWIQLSDQLLVALVYDIETLTQLQTYKGWFYIQATALLLFLLIRHQFKASQEKESYNRTLFEQSTIGLALSEVNGVLVDINPAYAHIIGRSVEDCLLLSYWDITPEKFTELEQLQLDSLEKTGNFGPYEKEYIHKDGHLVPVRLSGKIIYRDGEKMILANVEDITEQKRVEEKMLKSEHDLVVAQRMAKLGSWELDLIANQLLWSDETYQIFGVDPNDFALSYGAFLQIVHPDDRKWVDKLYMDSVDNKKPYNSSHRLLMQDGSVKLVSENCKTIYDPQGNPVRSIGIVQDITEQYHAELTLKKLNRMLSALSSCKEVLIRAESEAELYKNICRIIVDIGQYTQCWIGLINYDDEAILPVAYAGYGEKQPDQIKMDDVNDGMGSGWCKTAIQNGLPCIIRDIHADNRFANLREQSVKQGYSSIAALPFNCDNKPLGVLLIYAEDGNSFDDEEVDLLQKLVDNLAYGVVTLRSHKERDLLNKQLQQAQKMEAIGQLTGGIAHDFNNILTSILGFTNLALQRFVTDDQTELKDYLNEVSQAGERARDLVGQMLAYSRTGSSNAGSLQLAPMIKEVTKLMQATLPSSIQQSVQIDPDLPSVMMEPVQFQQILMNTCINARDAMSGKGKIDIRLRLVHIDKVNKDYANLLADSTALNLNCDSCLQEIASGDYIELSIKDSGEGISEKLLSRIFEPFFTTKSIGEGSGMGLSMVHGLMHEYGGHIFVDTEVGAGTTFRLLFLPVLEEDSNLTEADQPSEELPQGDGRHVLVLDDEPAVAEYIGDLLDLYGFKVTVKTHSKDAVNLFKQDPEQFELLITDLTMPDLTGIEVIDQVRQIRPDFPVILCSGYSANAGENEAEDQYIRYHDKPIDADALIRSAVELLKLPSK